MKSVRLFLVLLIGIFTLSCNGTVSIPSANSVSLGTAGSVGSLKSDEGLSSEAIQTTAVTADGEIDRKLQSESCDNTAVLAAGLAVEHNSAVKTDSIVHPQTVTSPPVKERSVFSRYDPVTKKRVLTYYGLMLAGAVARSASATAVHPLNVIKIMLQTKDGKMPEFKWSVLSRGAGSQFIMSIPHGALNFAVTETTKVNLAKACEKFGVNKRIPIKVLNPLQDFMSSALSTFICSIVSTPQMVLTDRIMAGVYSNFFVALHSIGATEGIGGYYKGWFPALAQKIPSYALTWMFFQQLKARFFAAMGRAGTTLENTLIGAFAAAGAASVMIPFDTVKTRMVMQSRGEVVYSGMIDCFAKIIKYEGVGAFYRSLPPRLMSVAPMIGIQFGVYELMKRVLLGAPPPIKEKAMRDAQLKQLVNMTPQEAAEYIRQTMSDYASHAADWLENYRNKTITQLKGGIIRGGYFLRSLRKNGKGESDSDRNGVTGGDVSMVADVSTSVDSDVRADSTDVVESVVAGLEVGADADAVNSGHSGASVSIDAHASDATNSEAPVTEENNEELGVDASEERAEVSEVDVSPRSEE